MFAARTDSELGRELAMAGAPRFARTTAVTLRALSGLPARFVPQVVAQTSLVTKHQAAVVARFVTSPGGLARSSCHVPARDVTEPASGEIAHIERTD